MLPDENKLALDGSTDSNLPERRVFLRIVVPGHEHQELELADSGQLFVGRERGTARQSGHLFLPDKSVSRRHALVKWNMHDIKIEDCGSTHGTWVNGYRILGPYPLILGDDIRLGLSEIQLRSTTGLTPPGAGDRSAHIHDLLSIDGESMILCDTRMKAIYQRLRRLAESELPILLGGETGVGKELAARAIHHWSYRKQGTFRAINCAAIPETLIESELFGHTRGAFTDAKASKKGVFEIAHGGTLFLDEIGSLTLAAQEKLLRILQTGQCVQVGGTEERLVDVRIVAATSDDLLEQIRKKLFRKDLYYRIAGDHIEIPPLRQRKVEIEILAQYFLRRECARLQKPRLVVVDGVYELLRQHSWSGNIRELESFITKIVVLTENSRIEPQFIAKELRRLTDSQWNTDDVQIECDNESIKSECVDTTYEQILQQAGRDAIIRVLSKTGGNVSRAASLLNISRSSINRLIKEFNIRHRS